MLQINANSQSVLMSSNVMYVPTALIELKGIDRNMVQVLVVCARSTRNVSANATARCHNQDMLAGYRGHLVTQGIGSRHGASTGYNRSISIKPETYSSSSDVFNNIEGECCPLAARNEPLLT